jgi:exodeoxyribonuclease-3
MRGTRAQFPGSGRASQTRLPAASQRSPTAPGRWVRQTARVRLATWNVNSVRARLPRLLDWLGTAAPDVVCLQETKCDDSQFPTAALAEAGYASASHGTGRWNGVALLSRVGLTDVTPGLPGAPGFPDVQPRYLEATCGGVRVASLYVPNGRTLADPAYPYKLAWLAALREHLSRQLAADPALPLVVAGDWNIAPLDTDVWDIAVFAGATHVSQPERDALQVLRDLGLRDLLAEHRPAGTFTYWDYRQGMFRRGMGMRIDHLLATAPVADATREAWVDVEARRGTGASDHAPVVVQLELPAPA